MIRPLVRAEALLRLVAGGGLRGLGRQMVQRQMVQRETGHAKGAPI